MDTDLLPNFGLSILKRLASRHLVLPLWIRWKNPQPLVATLKLEFHNYFSFFFFLKSFTSFHFLPLVHDVVFKLTRISSWHECREHDVTKSAPNTPTSCAISALNYFNNAYWINKTKPTFKLFFFLLTLRGLLWVFDQVHCKEKTTSE